MGIGKTMICIGTCHVQNAINQMWRDIGLKPEEHCPQDHQSPDQRCPQNEKVREKWGYDCPCAPANVTHRFRSILGVPVVIVPAPLKTNWCREWLKAYSDENGKEVNPHQMALVLGHTDARAADHNFLTPEKKALMRPTHSNNANQNDLPIYRARYCNSRVMFLTTSQSFDSKVVTPFNIIWQKTYQAPSYKRKDGTLYTPKPTLKSQKYNQLVMSSVWRDEAHLEKLPTSKTISVLQSGIFKYPHNRSVHFNIMSGTLLTTGPSDIAAYLNIMQRSSWASEPELSKWQHDEATTVGKQWDAVTKSGKVTDDNIQSVITVLRPLLEALVLRFKLDS